MKALRQLLRCDTQDDCRRIQRGYLQLRRLGKWSVLFTGALVLLINDVIAKCVDRIALQYDHAREQYYKITESVFYRWTFGWFYPPAEVPKLDERVLALYYILNFLQFTFFLVCCVYCLRWVYADFRAEGDSKMFSKFCLIAVFTNLALYLVLKTLVSGFLE